MIRAMFDEAHRRDPETRRRWIELVDGDTKQLRAVRTAARQVEESRSRSSSISCMSSSTSGRPRARASDRATRTPNPGVSNRLLELLGGRTGGQVARTIRGWAERKELDAAGERAINSACGYLADRTRTRLMRYADAMQDGLPIATGVIEGACRHVVKDRMDRTGARWSLTGAEAVLRLRAVRASGDFDAYWEFHLTQEKTRTPRNALRRRPDP